MAKSITYSSMNDLIQKARVSLGGVRVEEISKRLDMILILGRQALKNNDFENAYIYFKRWQYFVDFIQKKEKNDAKIYSSSINEQDVLMVKKKLQELNKRLTLLYESKKNLTSVSESTNSSKNSPADTLLSLPDTPPEDPLIEEPEDITCTRLYQLLFAPNEKKVLLIDIRPRTDYQNSRIHSDRCINIPPTEIRGGILCKRFEEFLEDSRSKKLFEDRKLMDVIVLMDWSASQINSKENKLFLMKDILTNWDTAGEHKNVSILKGGYSEWLHRYPQFVTNSRTELPNAQQNVLNDILDDFEFPSILDDDVPKTHKVINETAVPKVRNVPFFDRSNKPTSSLQEQKVRELMKELYSVKKNIEDLDTRKLNEERDWLNQQLSDDKPSVEVSRKKLTLYDKDLDKWKIKSDKIEKELKNMNITKEEAFRYMDGSLHLRLGSIEQKQRGIEIHREKVYKDFEKKKNEKLSSSKEKEEIIYKERLKDTPSMDSNLKRSFSSPDLAQAEDRKIPEVDRSSKPSAIAKENVSTNLNNNIKRLTLSSKDREDRLEPVFRGESHPGITGLKNLGNSCYMNSIIQCLSNTAHLAKYFNDDSYVDDLNNSNEHGTQGQVAEEVAHVIKALWRGQYKSISPRDLKVVIGQYRLQFESYEQQDSHEFLTFLLEWMHNDLKTKDKIPVCDFLTVAEKEWMKAMNGQNSIISRLFFGQLKSTITCSTCGNNSTTYETFNSLTMSLPSSAKCTLDDCIRKYVSGQRVSGWKCPHCKVEREATKKFDFIKLAPIVVIHLNRFGESDGWLEKRNTQVDFPLTDFNLRPYVVNDSDSNVIINNTGYNYSLYAMSNHYGTMEGGHYTAYCKSAPQNKWYKYDDHTVTEVSSNQVKSQNASAYLLFYTSLQTGPYSYL